MPTAPYGSWPSPISPETLVRGSAGLDHTTGLVVGGAVYWTRSDPDDGGRVGLLRASLATGPPAPVEATPGRYIRTAVNEYGGGAWTVAADADGEIVVYSEWPSNDLRTCGAGVPDRLLAPGGPFRYGALMADTARRVVLAVREDHRGDGEPVTTVVALDLAGDNPDGGRVIAAGADFYASPVLGPDGRVSFVQWNHPDMPWDATALMVVPLDGSTDPVLVSSGQRESAVYPAWTAEGALVYLSDLSGYWNFRLWD
ncbi:MAG: S9 family peptidase, partial [Micrococcales bacterium]|nr:S9 family peptidase [Micrococcales bacterium]